MSSGQKKAPTSTSEQLTTEVADMSEGQLFPNQNPTLSGGDLQPQDVIEVTFELLSIVRQNYLTVSLKNAQIDLILDWLQNKISPEFGSFDDIPY